MRSLPAYFKRFTSTAILLILVAGIGGLTNYAFQLLAARYLPVNDYGNLVIFFSISGFIGLTFIGAQTNAIQSVTKDDLDLRKTNFRKDKRLIFLIFSTIPGLWLVTVLLIDALNINLSTTFLALLVAGIPISLFANIVTGRLIGAEKFNLNQIISLVQTLLKLIALILVLTIGFGLLELLLLMMVISTFVTLILYLWLLKYTIAKNSIFNKALVPTTVLLLTNWFISNYDLLYIKYSCDYNSFECSDKLIGSYAAALTVNKGIIFIPVIVSSFIIPIIKKYPAFEVITFINKYFIFLSLIPLSFGFVVFLSSNFFSEVLFQSKFSDFKYFIYWQAPALVLNSLATLLLSVLIVFRYWNFILWQTLLILIFFTSSIFIANTIQSFLVLYNFIAFIQLLLILFYLNYKIRFKHLASNKTI
jgi:O-antigen/teichoic acid export membrane protein